MSIAMLFPLILPTKAGLFVTPAAFSVATVLNRTLGFPMLAKLFVPVPVLIPHTYSGVDPAGALLTGAARVANRWNVFPSNVPPAFTTSNAPVLEPVNVGRKSPAGSVMGEPFAGPPSPQTTTSARANTTAGKRRVLVIARLRKRKRGVSERIGAAARWGRR